MASTNIAKTEDGGRYKYVDIAHINEWLELNGISYYQYVERIEGDDYIYTVPIIEGKELPPRRGCRIVDATLIGIKNPAQEQGSAITYARRYSLLMAFGLATEDDDGQCLTVQPKKEEKPKEEPKAMQTDASKVLVGKAHIATVKAEMKKKNVTDKTVLSYYSIKAFEEMTMAQFTDCLDMLKKTKVQS